MERTLLLKAMVLSLRWMVACLVLTATAQAEPVRVVFQLDWIHNVQFAGLHWADKNGLFAKRGLQVEIRPFAKNQETIEAALAAGAPVFGSVESNVLLAARARGLPVVAIGTMFQGSPMGWMSLESSGISRVEDLRGRRVGVHPDGDKVIDLVLRRHGMTKADVSLVTIGHDPSAVIDGTVDVMQGYVIDEFVKLQLRTKGKGRIILAKDHGYAAYSQVVFTTEETLEKHLPLARELLTGLQEGWTQALDNVEAAVDLTMANYNPSLDRDYQIASLRAIDALVRPGDIKPLSSMTRSSWEEGQRIFLGAGLIEKPVELDKLVRTDLIPR